MSANGNGKVSVQYDISGTGVMDEIGVKTITIYENGVSVKTFTYTTTPSMMAYNKSSHYGSVSYNGVSGKSYYAIVTFWAGKQGGGDSRTPTHSTLAYLVHFWRLIWNAFSIPQGQWFKKTITA